MEGTFELGLLALAMIVGAGAALTALAAGNSLVIVLAVYSGCGVLSAVIFLLITAAMMELHARRPQPVAQLNLDEAL